MIIKEVTSINAESKKNIVAYSIDAGFHVFLFALADHLEVIENRIMNNEKIKENIETFIQTKIGECGVKLV